MIEDLEESEIKDLKKQFMILDINKTGYITFEELEQVLEQYGMKIHSLQF